jgi:epoxyqueuosine reductase QueG
MAPSNRLQRTQTGIGAQKEVRMDGLSLREYIADLVLTSEQGALDPAIALRDDLVGMRLFDAPLFGCAAADDTAFLSLKDGKVVGPHHFLPADFLPGAVSVLSVFLPFTRRVKDSNVGIGDNPSDEWLHARIEGQKFMGFVAAEAVKRLREEGFAALAPMSDGRFRSGLGPNAKIGDSEDSPAEHLRFTSNWSERHIAYVCGLGTFSLSKGLITEKGVAGRYFSLLTDLRIETTPHRYTTFEEYCIRCGKCAAPCPVGAITPENGKDHAKCSDYLDDTARRYAPRYGCGKCQVGVPCESAAPGLRRK